MVETENVGIGFAAVFAAGASTAVGAAVVFFPRLVKLASRRVLASSLGFSAGVMTYVSFVEIFQKSVGAYYDNDIAKGRSEEAAEARSTAFATLSFFAGAVIMVILDFIIDSLSPKHQHHGDPELGDIHNPSSRSNEEVVVPHCIGCTEDPVRELSTWQNRADQDIAEEIQEEERENQTSNISKESDVNVNFEGNQAEDLSNDGNVDLAEQQKIQVEIPKDGIPKEEEKQKLVHMGVATAVAIALHNFPEGLATFIAVLDDPKVGAILAVAIAIHNIPEGLCVALPVYYATGNRWKAFCWGALSGASEPIGAFFGWLVFAGAASDTVYGVMFGIVAGMMVVISCKELLPTAHRFDPQDTVVTYSFIVGMVVMALSLCLFYV